jgi:hypothetical protein
LRILIAAGQLLSHERSGVDEIADLMEIRLRLTGQKSAEISSGKDSGSA